MKAKDPEVMAQSEISESTSLVAERLHQRLGLSGRDLSVQVAKAGRLLPRGMRKRAEFVAMAQQMAAHPKLYMQVDPQRLEREARQLGAYLKNIDPAEQRKTRWLGIAGSVVFSLIVTFALLITVLVWRGFL